MKKAKIIYWIATGLMIAMIGLGSFADIFMIDALRQTITQHGFPVHFLPFFGIAKLLAVVVIVFSNVALFQKLKLSAYVGLFWYFAGAVYSHIAIGDAIEASMGAVFAFIIVLVSYYAWHKMENIR